MGKVGKQLCKGCFKDRPSQLGERESVSTRRRTKRPDSSPALQQDGCVTLRQLLLSLQKSAFEHLSKTRTTASLDSTLLLYQRTASVNGFQPFSPPNTPFMMSASFPLLSWVGTRLSHDIYLSEVSDDHMELIQLEGKARKEKKGILSCDWQTRALYTSKFCGASYHSPKCTITAFADL